MEKVALFLDIDGVLNSVKSCKRTLQQQYPIDNENIVALKKLISFIEDEGYQVDIILSSTWRIGKTLDMLQEIFQPYDLTICSKTNIFTGLDRGIEIREFMEANTDYNYCVILDDDIDMVSMSHFYIPVDATIGLQFNDDLARDTEDILAKKYHLWRSMNWVIHNPKWAGNEFYYSNQPRQWIAREYYKFLIDNELTDSEASFWKFVGYDETGLVLKSIRGDK